MVMLYWLRPQSKGSTPERQKMEQNRAATKQALPARRDVALAYRSQDVVQRLSLSALGVRTVIDEGVEIEGDVHSTTSVSIKGRLRGTLHIRGESGLVIIFPGAHVEGKVRARYVWLAGELHGKVECQRLLILPGGHFAGDSVCETLEVKHGGDYFPKTATKEQFDASL